MQVSLTQETLLKKVYDQARRIVELELSLDTLVAQIEESSATNEQVTDQLPTKSGTRTSDSIG